MRESGGRTGPSTINKWNINWKRGIPSMGLMQTIGPTFNAFKARGWNDIMNPIHNAAAINYIKFRYGNVYNVPGTKALAQGRPYVGYATGTRVAQHGLYEVSEEGHPEWVIPTDPRRRTEAMKLLALAGREITGNKRPNQLPNTTGGTIDTTDNSSEILSVLKDIFDLLASAEFDVNFDDKKLARILEKPITAIQNRKQGRVGRYAPNLI
ncbi:Transglycosylase SLT domain-containing protein [Terribacillus saccharophilus]|uniref:Transglycosylase SLT domain-containing protein n=2 Tax=Terribacillus saccharophilus TaxID=361277 RepID=A0AAX2EDD6_9BACI|nr:Transglycosylase SLT domain-containing protein [Terribacillus saccharophilus]